LYIISHLHPGLPSGLFPSGFLAKIWYAFLIYPGNSCFMPHPSHLILLDFVFILCLSPAF
jgi:hypothetical protein